MKKTHIVTTRREFADRFGLTLGRATSILDKAEQGGLCRRDLKEDRRYEWSSPEKKHLVSVSKEYVYHFDALPAYQKVLERAGLMR